VLVGDLAVGAATLLSQVWVLDVRLRHEEAMVAEHFGPN